MAERSLRILVAEDNEVSQLVIRGMLELAGFDVDTVSNGEKAIEALEETRYDLILMDCLMPILNGFETTREIRTANPTRFDPDIPILAITALASAEDRLKCMDAGMSGYLSKPVEANLLYQWIEKNISSEFHLDKLPQPKPTKVSPQGKDPKGSALPGLNLVELRLKTAPVFIRDASQWQLELSILFETGDFTRLQALAHKIRGSADIFGYAALSEIAASLEKFDLANTGNELEVLVSSLQNVLHELVQEMLNEQVVTS